MNVQNLTKFELIHDLISQKEKIARMHDLFYSLLDLVADPQFKNQPEVQSLIKMVNEMSTAQPVSNDVK